MEIPTQPSSSSPPSSLPLSSPPSLSSSVLSGTTPCSLLHPVDQPELIGCYGDEMFDVLSDDALHVLFEFGLLSDDEGQSREDVARDLAFLWGRMKCRRSEKEAFGDFEKRSTDRLGNAEETTRLN